jgi:hypothetical protein
MLSAYVLIESEVGKVAHVARALVAKVSACQSRGEECDGVLADILGAFDRRVARRI